jgi:hypothetical protein
MDFFIELNIFNSWDGVVLLCLVTYIATQVHGIKKAMLIESRNNLELKQRRLREMNGE